jgi:transcriptional regulator GlxA family with amidase domain
MSSKHISILLLHNVNLVGIENVRQAFQEINTYLQSRGDRAQFTVELVGLESEIKLQNGLYTIKADRTIDSVSKSDVIIIPPLRGNIPEGVELNKRFIPWIIQQYKSGAEIVSLCLGSFLLAGTGLLNGKSCVTHWKAGHDFKKAYPKVHLVTDKLITDEQGIYTGGGAFSSANLILYIIEKYAGRDAAIYCSKIFQVDLGRESQSPFIIFTGQKDHSDSIVLKAQHHIEEHHHERITVEDLCQRYGVGRRTFERRFKKATGITILEYHQRVKVEAAKRALEKGSKTVSEIMYDVGYSDAKAFRDMFRKYAGLTPADYKMKYVRKLSKTG